MLSLRGYFSGGFAERIFKVMCMYIYICISREGLVLSIRVVPHLTERIDIIVVALVKRVVALQPSHYPRQAHLRTLLYTVRERSKWSVHRDGSNLLGLLQVASSLLVRLGT